MRKRLLKRRPVRDLRDSLPRQVIVALFIASLDRDEHLVARLHGLRVAIKGRTGKHTFRFEPNVQDHGVGCEGNHSSLDLTAAGLRLRMRTLKLPESISERFG